ncbi:hypothetical protein CHS0354_012978 [Potamilus streckersoni]|uniref:Uncharacterized protein n=1 Tax=Potamilus streckersoni TaxID=2493646 RepID=A0AAE0W7P2_9BIVA|nr:hypothetical protein CHS0354_012978 [Potamilus streckersoni]
MRQHATTKARTKAIHLIRLQVYAKKKSSACDQPNNIDPDCCFYDPNDCRIEYTGDYSQHKGCNGRQNCNLTVVSVLTNTSCDSTYIDKTHYMSIEYECTPTALPPTNNYVPGRQVLYLWNVEYSGAIGACRSGTVCTITSTYGAINITALDVRFVLDKTGQCTQRLHIIDGSNQAEISCFHNNNFTQATVYISMTNMLQIRMDNTLNYTDGYVWIQLKPVMNGATLSGSCMAQRPLYGCGDKLPSTEDAPINRHETLCYNESQSADVYSLSCPYNKSIHIMRLQVYAKKKTTNCGLINNRDPSCCLYDPNDCRIEYTGDYSQYKGCNGRQNCNLTVVSVLTNTSCDSTYIDKTHYMSIEYECTPAALPPTNNYVPGRQVLYLWNVEYSGAIGACRSGTVCTITSTYGAINITALDVRFVLDKTGQCTQRLHIIDGSNQAEISCFHNNNFTQATVYISMTNMLQIRMDNTLNYTDGYVWIQLKPVMNGATLSGSCMAQRPVYGCGDKLPSTEDAPINRHETLCYNESQSADVYSCSCPYNKSIHIMRLQVYAKKKTTNCGLINNRDPSCCLYDPNDCRIEYTGDYSQYKGCNGRQNCNLTVVSVLTNTSCDSTYIDKTHYMSIEYECTPAALPPTNNYVPGRQVLYLWNVEYSGAIGACRSGTVCTITSTYGAINITALDVRFVLDKTGQCTQRLHIIDGSNQAEISCFHNNNFTQATVYISMTNMLQIRMDNTLNYTDGYVWIQLKPVMNGATLSGSCMAQRPVYGCGDKLPSTEDAPINRHETLCYNKSQSADVYSLSCPYNKSIHIMRLQVYAKKKTSNCGQINNRDPSCCLYDPNDCRIEYTGDYSQYKECNGRQNCNLTVVSVLTNTSCDSTYIDKTHYMSIEYECTPAALPPANNYVPGRQVLYLWNVEYSGAIGACRSGTVCTITSTYGAINITALDVRFVLDKTGQCTQRLHIIDGSNQAEISCFHNNNFTQATVYISVTNILQLRMDNTLNYTDGYVWIQLKPVMLGGTLSGSCMAQRPVYGCGDKLPSTEDAPGSHTEIVCKSTTRMHSLQCQQSEVIYISAIRVYAKNETSSCGRSQQNNLDYCCFYDPKDCEIKFTGDYTLNKECNGKQSCNIPFVSVWTNSSCDSSYIDQTHYMRVDYQCISDPISLNETKTGWTSVFVWNIEYQGPMTACQSGVICKLRSSYGTINVTALDLRLAYDNNQTCAQTIHVTDGSAEYIISCAHNNKFQPVHLFVSNSSELLFRIDNKLNRTDGYFWFRIDSVINGARISAQCWNTTPVYRCGDELSPDEDDIEHTSTMCVPNNTYAQLYELSCPDERVIQVLHVYLFAKRTLSGCKGVSASTRPDCCTYDDEDCAISYTQDYSRYFQCNGKQSCYVTVASIVTDRHCDPGYIDTTHYMNIVYDCIKESRIGAIDSDKPVGPISPVPGGSVYISNYGYKEGIAISACQTGGVCDVHTTLGFIQIIALDIRFSFDIQGKCVQRLVVKDGENEKSITCYDNNNFEARILYTSKTNNISFRLDNTYLEQGGMFWIKLTATEVSASLRMNCGPQVPVYNCGDSLPISEPIKGGTGDGSTKDDNKVPTIVGAVLGTLALLGFATAAALAYNKLRKPKSSDSSDSESRSKSNDDENEFEVSDISPIISLPPGFHGPGKSPAFDAKQIDPKHRNQMPNDSVKLKRKRPKNKYADGLPCVD